MTDTPEEGVTSLPLGGSDPSMLSAAAVPRLGPDRDPRSDPDAMAALVARAQAGDDKAFEELVSATHAETYTLARRITGSDDDARDVVQEAYLRAYRSIGRFRGEARFTTWMYRITANCASTYVGKRRRHRHDELVDDMVVVDTRPDLDPAAQADASDLRGRLVLALDELPPKLRAVVVLRDVYDLPHEAIAAELGISESAAKVRLHRARRKLKDHLFPGRDDAGDGDAGEDLP
ncbi:RNA polymerase sigma factor [Iamia sp. SCSIO 61187]|uniref:RNA polymerase sigma factor n=1 Tax=Iamia sp. SCSIO 61187 TaxID=2722752 RepID=UPI001C62D930|nr:RNA polymerase sigma factor [Iamia sp. SCSIO 61187]QYG94787.1 RNA polymerase sigma factor [Iamia sp. SCSIO 61187]